MKKSLIFLLAAALFFSCTNISHDDGASHNSADGGTYLVVRSSSVRRTVVPGEEDAGLGQLKSLVLKGTRIADSKSTPIVEEEQEELTLINAESYEKLKDELIPIQTGNWSFTLSADLNGITFSDTVEKKIEAGKENEISFKLSVAEGFGGGLGITLSFTDASTSVTRAKATLTAMDEGSAFEAETQSYTGEKGDFAFKENVNGEQEAVIYFSHAITDESSRIPDGTYKLVFDFYVDGYDENDIVQLEPVTYIVRIADGITTTYSDTIRLNETYTITYKSGATEITADMLATSGSEFQLEEGEVWVTKFSRKSGKITLPKITRAGYIFGGWYVKSGSGHGDFKTFIETIPANTSGSVTLNAMWYEPGHVTTDNRVLNVAISADSIFNGANSTITFSATDADGNEVTEGVTYTAQILYKGDDVNELAATGTVYYTVIDNKLSLVSALPQTGTYQLYVTASQALNNGDNTPVVSSQTFDIDISSTLPIVLTNLESSKTVFYLANSVDEDISTLSPVLSPNLRQSEICAYELDSEGNLYVMAKDLKSGVTTSVLQSNKMFTDSSTGTDSQLSCTLTELQDYNDYYESAIFTGFAIDLAKNVFYAYSNKTEKVTLENEYGTEYTEMQTSSEFDVFKYPSLISEGSVADSVKYTITLEGYIPLRAVVYNAKLYCLAKSSSGNSFSMFAFTLPDETSSFTLSDSTPVNLTSGLLLSSYAVCNYMTYSDGNIYLTFSENNTSGSDFVATPDIVSYDEYDGNLYARGLLIKYDTNPDATTPVTHIGFSDNSFKSSRMYMGESGDGYTWYGDEEGLTLATVEASLSLTSKNLTSTDPETVNTKISGQTLGDYFPTVHAPSSLVSSFAGPGRILAVMPKKLVLLDSGICIYANTDDALAFYNVKRTVTVDLESFAFEQKSAPVSASGDMSAILLNRIDFGNDIYLDDLLDDCPSSYYLNNDGNYEACGWPTGSMYMYIKDETDE